MAPPLAKTNTSVEARQGVALQRDGISIENNAIHHGKEEGNWSALFDWLINILLFGYDRSTFARHHRRVAYCTVETVEFSFRSVSSGSMNNAASTTKVSSTAAM